MKVMHSTPTTLYFLQVNKDEKEMDEVSKTTCSIYSFLVEDWLKTFLDKPIKEEGWNLIGRRLRKIRTRNEERKFALSLESILSVLMFSIPLNFVPYGAFFKYMFKN